MWTINSTLSTASTASTAAHQRQPPTVKRLNICGLILIKTFASDRFLYQWADNCFCNKLTRNPSNPPRSYYIYHFISFAGMLMNEHVPWTCTVLWHENISNPVRWASDPTFTKSIGLNYFTKYFYLLVETVLCLTSCLVRRNSNETFDPIIKSRDDFESRVKQIFSAFLLIDLLTENTARLFL